MATSTECIEELKSIHALLQHNMRSNEEKNIFQNKIYTDVYRIFNKHSSKLATLANSINEEVLQAANQEELAVQYYQMLSNSLLRLADCSRRVSLRCKSEVLDPLKTFNQNYQNIYDDLHRKISQKIQLIVNQDQETTRLRDSYNLSYQKFQKHRQMQKKVIEKIQNGNKTELEKFNMNTKKLTEQITSSQKFYHSSVEKLNNQWNTLRKQLAVINQSITYNENTRQAFFKKTVMNTIRTIEEFNLAYDAETIRKIEQSGKSSDNKVEDMNQKKMRILLNKITSNNFKEEFISYQDMVRSKKKRFNEEQSHLVQYFSRVKDKDKKLILDLINPWFFFAVKKFNDPISPLKQGSKQIEERQNGEKTITKVKSLMTINSSQKQKPSKDKATQKAIRQMDHCKQKIISQPPHSFYFIELLFQKISDMNAFYCKVNEDNFFYLLNAFTVITKNIDADSDIGIEFIYKMMMVSQRIMLKKSQTLRQGTNQPIELLCQKYGKNSMRFRDQKLFPKLLAYIEKRKSNKKKNTSENKGTLNNFAKGILAALTYKKSQILTDDELYNCLEQFIKIIANFSVPNEVILPFIKQYIGNTHQSSYEYLKGIILNKKDVEQRQSLFYRKEIKEKKEELLKKALQNKKMGQYVIKILAQHGFLDKSQISYRLICTQLKDIHLQILAKLNISSEKKWIHLIPVDKQLHYINMKQEVAQQSVPSAVQEIITLDVNRSLHMHGESLNPTILHSLLRTYAYFHKEISYCQGMNYLAGYIYIKTLNEEYTYRIFEYMMQMRFKEIFINQFEVLKVKMYQFQRLLAIFHPQISEHFKRQSISPECYIVSWIITLFASSYQYTMSSFLIDFLWERFIIWGWPEFFRFVLWIFSLFKEDLVELTYDRALHFLGQLGRSKMFLSNQQEFKKEYTAIQDPKAGIQRYPVSEELLNKFTQQYKLDK